MLNRTEQSWPEGTAIDISTLKEITAHGVSLEQVSEREILQTAVHQAVRRLRNPAPELAGVSPEELYAFQHGWLKGNVDTALTYLLDALSRVPMETERVTAEMEGEK